MSSIRLPFDGSRDVSSVISLLLVFFLGVIFGWYTIVTALRLADDVKRSEIVHPELRDLPKQLTPKP